MCSPLMYKVHYSGLVRTIIMSVADTKSFIARRYAMFYQSHQCEALFLDSAQLILSPAKHEVATAAVASSSMAHMSISLCNTICLHPGENAADSCNTNSQRSLSLSTLYSLRVDFRHLASRTIQWFLRSSRLIHVVSLEAD
jgi:hypothetical protein